MYIQKFIRDNIQTALKETFQFESNSIELQQTKKETWLVSHFITL